MKSYEGTRQPSRIGDPVNEEMHAPRFEPRKTREEPGHCGKISSTSSELDSTPPK